MSSRSEKRQCGLFVALEGHKPAGGNEGGRALGGLSQWDEYFCGDPSSIYKAPSVFVTDTMVK